MSAKEDSKTTSSGWGGAMKDQAPVSQSTGLQDDPFCAPVREWADRGWADLVPRCGGCLSPRMTIRLLGSFVLVCGVMVSSAEGSLLLREEQKYQRCLLRQNGLVGDRHLIQSPEKDTIEDLLLCYPNDINMVRALACTGAILLVMLLLCTILMFVAVATDRWHQTLPWGYGCGILILHELILVGGCWSFLGMGDLVLYTIHILLLAYSATTLSALLGMVRTGEYYADDEEDGEP